MDPAPEPAGDAPAAEPLPLPAGDDSEAVSPSAGSFPTQLQALTDSVVRSGASNTRSLLAALSPLGEQGMTAEQSALVGFGRFPVAGDASYTHDWWFPRFGPGWRLHEGTDIFAPMGTPVRAPADGTVRISQGGLGGVAVYVIEPDGTYYYLAHLASVAPSLVDGKAVATGEIVGSTGNSGNALGSPPHVHLEIHPFGGPAVDPKPLLDRFIAEALAAAPGVVESYSWLAAANTARDSSVPPAGTTRAEATQTTRTVTPPAPGHPAGPTEEPPLRRIASTGSATASPAALLVVLAVVAVLAGEATRRRALGGRAW